MPEQDFDNLSVIIDGDTINEALETTSRLFAIPDHAARKGDPQKNGGEARWTQTFEITRSTGKVEDGQVIFEIDYTQPADATDGSPKNMGKSLRQWYRITVAAIKNKEHEKFKGTNWTIARLSALLRGCGLGDAIVAAKAEGRSLDFGAYLTPRDGTTWVLGKRIVGSVHHSWYNGKPQQQITDVLDPMLVG